MTTQIMELSIDELDMVAGGDLSARDIVGAVGAGVGGVIGGTLGAGVAGPVGGIVGAGAGAGIGYYLADETYARVERALQEFF